MFDSCCRWSQWNLLCGKRWWRVKTASPMYLRMLGKSHIFWYVLDVPIMWILKSQRISFPFLILLKHLLWYTSSISISNSLGIWTILPAEEKLIFLLLSVKPGIRFREIGEVINRHASMSGFSVVIYYLNLHFFSISIFWKGLDSFY